MRFIISKFLLKNAQGIYTEEIFDFYQDAWKIQNKRKFKKFKLQIEQKDFLLKV